MRVSDNLFQLTWAILHFSAAILHFGSGVYHIRRVWKSN